MPCPVLLLQYIKCLLFALSSLELGLLPELVMFMLAHLFLAPLLYITHTSTSSSLIKSKKNTANSSHSVLISFNDTGFCFLLYSVYYIPLPGP